MFKQLTNIVKSEKTGRSYYVSTANTLDMGLETMIFDIDDRGVVDWSGIFTRHHYTDGEARDFHQIVIKHIDDYV